LLEEKFGADFDRAILEDDSQPMYATTPVERERVLEVCWLKAGEAEEMLKQPLPLAFHFSEAFYQCCTHIRRFVEKFYQFAEGVSHHHRDIDDLLRKSLDQLTSKRIVDNLSNRLSSTSAPQQIAQVITNVEHFQVATTELEEQLTKLRASQRGGRIHLTSIQTFDQVLQNATDRLATVIKKKLDDIFELSEYNWTPPQPGSEPSPYLNELLRWLTTVVDTLQLEDSYKDTAYRAALEHVAGCFMEFLFGRDIPIINENGISNLLVDVDYLESEFKKLGRAELAGVFAELRLTTSIVLNNAVQEYLQLGVRQASYADVKPKMLAILLDKLSKAASVTRDRAGAERRRKEAESVSRIG
jgi:hypothetical protein